MELLHAYRCGDGTYIVLPPPGVINVAGVDEPSYLGVISCDGFEGNVRGEILDQLQTRALARLCPESSMACS